MFGLKESISRSIIETKDTYTQVIKHFKHLLYLGIPAVILMVLTEPLLIATTGLSLNERNTEALQDALPDIILGALVFMLLQLSYGFKAARAWHLLWLKGASSLQDYHLLKWTKEEMRFLGTSLLYTLVVFLVAVIAVVLAMSLATLITMGLSVVVSFMPEAMAAIFILIFMFTAMAVVFFAILIFGIRRVFILPAKAVGKPIKMKESRQLSKGHIKPILSTFLLSLGPIWIISQVIQSFSDNLASNIASGALNSVNYFIGFTISMLSVFIISRYYQLIIEENE